MNTYITIISAIVYVEKLYIHQIYNYCHSETKGGVWKSVRWPRICLSKISKEPSFSATTQRNLHNAPFT